MKKIITISLLLTSGLLLNTVSLAEGISNVVSSGLKKGEQVVTFAYLNGMGKRKSSGKLLAALGGGDFTSDYDNQTSKIDVSYNYALSNNLSLGIQIPYQLEYSWQGDLIASGLPAQTIKTEEEAGLDDISLGIRYTIKSKIPQSVSFEITLNSADTTEGQQERKGIPNNEDELMKYGPGADYNAYSLKYHVGVAGGRGWGVLLSPFYTHRDNDGGDSYGFDLAGGYQFNDIISGLFVMDYDIRDDHKIVYGEYKGNSATTMGFGVNANIGKAYSVKALYLTLETSEHDTVTTNHERFASETTQELSGTGFLVVLESSF